eukprot:gene3218-3495_t
MAAGAAAIQGAALPAAGSAGMAAGAHTGSSAFVNWRQQQQQQGFGGAPVARPGMGGLSALGWGGLAAAAAAAAGGVVVGVAEYLSCPAYALAVPPGAVSGASGNR